jgi:hypothetical protein
MSLTPNWSHKIDKHAVPLIGEETPYFKNIKAVVLCSSKAACGIDWSFVLLRFLQTVTSLEWFCSSPEPETNCGTLLQVTMQTLTGTV